MSFFLFKMLKVVITLFFGFAVAVLCIDLPFSFPGKLKKPNADYRYPTSMKISWFNLLEGDDSNRPWTWCGGGFSCKHFYLNNYKSLEFGGGFTYDMTMTQEMFDKNITTDPAVLPWWAESFNVPEDEISKIKYAMGYIIGHYDNDFQCRFGNDNGFDPPPGPNGEIAIAERYIVFYRNGSWPGPGPDEECSFIDWTSRIPQGFSCGLAVTQPNDCHFDEYVPVNCSEVVLKVGTPRHCDGGNFGSDCFDFPNWN